MDRVLVVDDDDGVRRLSTTVLSRMPLEVEAVATGEEALRLAHGDAYAVILLDLRLPGLGGIETLRRLKDQGCTAEIVMITGFGNVPAAVEAMQAGATDFIEKPFTPDQMQTLVRQMLAQRAAEDPIQDPVVSYIQRHATEIGNRNDVARRMGLSPESISVRVREATQLSFRRFLNACRLEIAKELLANTDLKIAQVAKRAGFQTPQHFSRVFTSRVGTAPGAYRRSNSK